MSGFRKDFQQKFGFDLSLVARRLAAAATDWTIEVGGGLLGSYFGVMVAALIVAMKNEPAEELQHSMWSGMGFGFVFWSLSIGFINRVLIQGLSRASLGKKLFKLELISSGQPLTWTTVMNRWVMSYVSIAAGGLGYAYLFFNKEARTFHDVVVHTDVVPQFAGSHMTMEYREEMTPVTPLSMQALSRVLVLSNTQAERPMATVIQLPVREVSEIPAAKVVGSDAGTSVAELIELHPKTKDEKKAA
jgi:hypothetical protein